MVSLPDPGFYDTLYWFPEYEEQPLQLLLPMFLYTQTWVQEYLGKDPGIPNKDRVSLVVQCYIHEHDWSCASYREQGDNTLRYVILGGGFFEKFGLEVDLGSGTSLAISGL